MYGYGYGYGNRRQRSGGPTYTSEAQALFAAMTSVPDDTRKGHINTQILQLKAGAAWTTKDVLYNQAAHDPQAARLNWKAPGTFTATAVNSPTFTTDRGFTGDGATSYLDYVYNPATAGLGYARDSAHIGVWVGTDASNAGQIDCGHTSAGINSRSATSLLTRVNNALDTTDMGLVTAIGWSCVSRDNSADYVAVRDLGTPSTITRASSAVVSLPFYGLARSAAGPVAGGFSTRRLQAFHCGSAEDDTKRGATHNALATYMTSVGG